MSAVRRQTISRLTELRESLRRDVARLDEIIAWLDDGASGPSRSYDVEAPDPAEVAARYGVDLDPDGEIPAHVAARIERMRSLG